MVLDNPATRLRGLLDHLRATRGLKSDAAVILELKHPDGRTYPASIFTNAFKRGGPSAGVREALQRAFHVHPDYWTAHGRPDPADYIDRRPVSGDAVQWRNGLEQRIDARSPPPHALNTFLEATRRPPKDADAWFFIEAALDVAFGPPKKSEDDVTPTPTAIRPRVRSSG